MRHLAWTIFVALLVACSSAPTPTSTNTTKKSTKTPPSAEGDSVDTPPATAPPTPGDDSSCKTKGDGCADCCKTAHPEGNNVLTSAVIDCVCGTGPCATQCASTICKDAATVASDACLTCTDTAEGQGGACHDPISQACQGSADCKALLACLVCQ